MGRVPDQVLNGLFITGMLQSSLGPGSKVDIELSRNISHKLTTWGLFALLK